MKEEDLRKLLEDLRGNRLSVEEGIGLLKDLPFRDLGFAVLDTHRELRHGFPETLFCEGKTRDQVAGIFREMLKRHRNLLATRATPEHFEDVRAFCPEAEYNALGRTLSVVREEIPTVPGFIAIVTAGTADLPVAEEAAVTAEMLGNRVAKVFDVGVAGVHRLLDRLEILRKARVLIVVAGMEGALPSVVGGLVGVPVIAVPTSVGYGASFGGVAALLAMLNSCAPGVTVVNIDNGYGAACAASRITRLSTAEKALGEGGVSP
jgi:NCAIR mutase (PurE)-related protein